MRPPLNQNESCTLFLFVTLGIREFCISPILTHVAPWKQYVHRRRELGIGNPLDDALPPPSENLSWSDLRTNRLFDSGLAGAVTGGLLRGLKSVLYIIWCFFFMVANCALY